MSAKLTGHRMGARGELVARPNWKALVSFAKEVIRSAWEGGQGGDTIQEAALKHGLLIEVAFDPESHSDPFGYAEEGDTWYLFAGPLADAATSSSQPVADAVVEVDWKATCLNVVEHHRKTYAAERDDLIRRGKANAAMYVNLVAACDSITKGINALSDAAALQSSAEAGGWRPMDSAPKDRTRIILAWLKPRSLPPHIELGYWSEGKATWVNTYGHAFSGAPDIWYLPPCPITAAPASRSDTNREG